MNQVLVIALLSLLPLILWLATGVVIVCSDNESNGYHDAIVQKLQRFCKREAYDPRGHYNRLQKRYVVLCALFWPLYLVPAAIRDIKWVCR